MSAEWSTGTAAKQTFWASQNNGKKVFQEKHAVLITLDYYNHMSGVVSPCLSATSSKKTNHQNHHFFCQKNSV